MKITMKMPHSFAPMIPGVDRKSDTDSSRTGGIGGEIGTGMLSILMVLIILLLSAFAVLSYSEARAENRLTEKTIQSAQDYYAADRRAEEILFTFHGYWAEGGAEEAKAKINTGLTVTGTAQTVIPAETGGERFCYEFTCKAGGEDCIIYIDCETGKEADILSIIHTNNGTLTE